VCGRTAAEVANVFEDDIAQAKEKELAKAKVGENEPNHADVYTEAEYELAKACQHLAHDLLSTPLDEYEEQRELLSTKYKGMETLDRLLRLPPKKNPIDNGRRQNTINDRIATIVGTYEDARKVDRMRSEKRQQIESRFLAVRSDTEWIRRFPVKLRKPGVKSSLPNLNLEVAICIACSAWEADLDEVKHRQCPP